MSVLCSELGHEHAENRWDCALHGLGGWRASMGADRINTEDTSGTSQSPGGVTLSRSCCRPCRRLLHVLFNEKREFYGGGGGNLQIFTLL